MRTLKFIVDGQIIKQDPNCDFTNLVPGTDGYLQAEFSFSKEWSKCTARVASFWSPLGREYPPQVLDYMGRCVIPAEALKKRHFRVKVIGKGEVKMTTNKVTVSQNGG